MAQGGRVTTTITTPIFDDTIKFEAYQREVEAWQEVTGIEKEKQALVLILALPDLKGEIFENLAIADLKKADGVTTYLNYLKGKYGKEEIIDSLEKYKSFRDYHRTEGMSMVDYCTGFDQRVNRIKQKGIAIPVEILAFELIRNAKITSAEEKLVLTGINFDAKEDMYKDATNSLKKFSGEGVSAIKADMSTTTTAIKLEPAYATWNRGSARGTGQGTRVEDRVSGNGDDFGGDQRNMNRRGRNGETLTCYICGSFMHLMDKCPHRWNGDEQE